MITDNATIVSLMESEISQMAIASATITDHIDNEWNAMQKAFCEME
ncbi:MAG: hypothetical protein HDS68_00110 [Bacteroidales bacterium]|nr:hypothetical protein [Bacteroidales bacterium]